MIRRFGGVYIDTDMECRKPLSPHLAGVQAFAGYYEPQEFDFVRSLEAAILGAVPNHPLFEMAVNEHLAWLDAHPYADRYLKYAAPYLACKILQRYPDVARLRKGETQPLSYGDFTLFPPRYFYPYHWSRMEDADLDHPHAIAIHRILSTWTNDWAWERG